MKTGSVVFLALGTIAVLWSVVLIFITKGIYDDGEYIGPHWMSGHTGMMAAGAVTGMVGTALFMRGHGGWKWWHGAAVLLFIGALASGFAFSWTGFSGFGGFFFGLFILAPVVLFVAIYGVALASLRRARRG